MSETIDVKLTADEVAILLKATRELWMKSEPGSSYQNTIMNLNVALCVAQEEFDA